jgi:hypothetical protein
MPRRLSLLILLFVLGSLLAVACGGDDDVTVPTASEVAEDEDGAKAGTETDEPEQAEPTTTSLDPTPTGEAEEPIATEPETGLTPTDAEQEATATESDVSDSVLVLPPERDASIPRDGRVLGDSGAPVQVVEYGDFQ